MTLFKGSIENLPTFNKLADFLAKKLKTNSIPENANLIVLREDRDPGKFILACTEYLDDTELSPVARMAMIYLTRHNETKFTISLTALKNWLNISMASTRKALNELESRGYLFRSQLKDPETNQYMNTYYSVSERSITKQPESTNNLKPSRVHNSVTRKPETRDRVYGKKHTNKNNNNKTNCNKNNNKQVSSIQNKELIPIKTLDQVNNNSVAVLSSINLSKNKERLVKLIMDTTTNDIPLAKAIDLVNNNPDQLIEDQCRWLDARKPLNRSAMLITSIENDYSDPNLKSTEKKKTDNEIERVNREIRLKNFTKAIEKNSFTKDPTDNMLYLFKKANVNPNYLNQLANRLKSLIKANDLNFYVNNLMKLKFVDNNPFYAKENSITEANKELILQAFS